MELVTIDHFLIAQQRKLRQATGEFSALLSDITFAAKVVAAEVKKAGLTDILGATEGKNVSGEVVQKLDEYAHEVFIKILGQGGRFAAFTSEESDDIVLAPEKGGKYIVHLDPLDGSSNIDVNVPVGTIFSIHRRVRQKRNPTIAEALQKGRAQVCAGYVLYGSSVMLVYTTGQGVHGFTFNPEIGEFLLSHPEMRMPATAAYYSTNEGYASLWSPGMARFMEQARQTMKARWIGSLVADFHRNLIKGGIFLMPGDFKNPQGKLRLMFEANPMAFVAEQAGGSSSNGKMDILDIRPTAIHQRTPLFLGGKKEIKLLEKLLKEE